MKQTITALETVQIERQILKCDMCLFTEQDFREMRLYRKFVERDARTSYTMRAKQHFCSAKCEGEFWTRWAVTHERDMNQPVVEEGNSDYFQTYREAADGGLRR